MEHVKRLSLVPEHTETPSRSLVQPFTAHVSQLDSDIGSLLKRQDLIEEEKAKIYSQILQRYLFVLL